MRLLLLVFLLQMLHQARSWCLRATLSEGSQIAEVDWAGDNSIFVTANKDDELVRIYNATTYEIVRIYNHSGNEPKSVKISKDSKWIAIGYDNSDLHVLSSTTFAPLFTKATAQDTIAEVDFSYDNLTVMSCGDDKGYKIYSLVPGAVLVDEQRLEPNPEDAESCRFSPLGYVGFAGDNQRTKMAVLNTPGLLFNINNGERINEIDFAPNSHNMVSASQNGRVRINNSSVIIDVSGALNTISFGKVGRHFAFGGTSKILFIHNQTNNRMIAKFNNFKDEINSVKISSDEQFILTGDVGGQVRVYAVKCQMKCQSGQYNDSNVCKRCSSAITYCVNCKSAASCDLCAAGYFPSGINCVPCYTNLNFCLLCSDASTCLKCFDGYYLDAGVCKKCPLLGCIECNSSSICTKCFRNDYYLDTTTNTCKQCADTLPNCIRCRSPTVCVDCQLGFYEDTSTGNCIQCPGNCLICQASNNCSECKVGYRASSGSCVRCTTTGCISCNQLDVCNDCKDGMFLTNTNTCTNCTNPCATCIDTAIKCTGCQLGYYHDSANFKCQKCIENCQSCNQSAKCLTCFSGFKVDATTSKCVACINFYPNCSECSTTQCFKCREGFYVDTAAGNTCKRCISTIPNCMQCGNSTTCLQCITGYFNTSSSGVGSCEACPAGCSECISSTNCTKCFGTYYRDGTSLLCKPCQSNCFECNSPSFCHSCVVGYYLEGGNSCKACTSVLAYCSSCADINSCVSCQIGAYLDTDSKCKLCTNNCLTCNKTDCLSCDVGFYLDSTATPLTCKKCQTYCQQCTSLAVCTSCIDGYYFDPADNKCKSCSSLFPYCSLCNKTNCFQCDIGTALNTTTSTSCPPCTNHIPNCKTCYWDNTAAPVVKCSLCTYGYGLSANSLACPSCNLIQGCIECKSSTSCTKCEIGYFLKPDNTCEKCLPKCFTCNSATTCISCNEGFVNQTNDCVLCSDQISGCSKCIVDTATTYNCTYCQVGFYLQAADNLCYICNQEIRGCYTCNDSSKCTSCLDRYYLEGSTHTCKKCVTNIPGCQLCNSSTVCIACQNSYYLDSSDDKCYFCSDNIPGCIYCKDNSLCQQCLSGYYLKADDSCGFCQAVLEGCIYCSSDTYCIQCRAGFYLDLGDNKCHKCTQAGCEVCSPTNPLHCVTCNSKFFLSGSTCNNCHLLTPYCDQCNSTQCLECQVGYYLSGVLSCTRCSSAISGCSRCTDGSTCLQCMSSYFLNSTNECQSCNQVIFGCQNCQNDSFCISCSPNYFLNSSTDRCQPCTDIEGCLMCRNQSSCVLCQQKYYIVGQECLLCSEAIKGCFSCVSNLVCVQCQSGYVLNPENYKCIVNSVEAKQKVQGLKLVSYYISPTMLKHVLFAKGTRFQNRDSVNVTQNGKTKLLVEEFTGKQIGLTVLSFQFSRNGYSIIFFTDNPLGDEVNQASKRMSFRRLLSGQEINLQVLLKMDQDVYQKILPELDYSGAVTVGYSLNEPEFIASYFQAEGGKHYFMYQIVGICLILLFLINYCLKLLFTLPHTKHRSTVLPHIIALKSCCLIMYPTYFEYLSFCKGFMIVDFPWANTIIASELTDLSDKVSVPFGLFFKNMSIAGTFLLGISVYIISLLIGQAVYYMKNEEEKPKKESEKSEASSQEQRQRQKQFKIQRIQQAIGINYDIDQSEGNKLLLYKKNLHEILWNIFNFSIAYFSCLSVQGAFYNFLQIITVNGIFYILGMLLFIYVTIETFYSFVRNFKMINKVRVYVKGCLLSLAYLNPIYVVSVCVAFDLLLAVLQFYIINKKTQFSKFQVLTHGLSTICVVLMIFVSDSLISLLMSGLCLLVCLGLEIFIHVKEYQIANQKLENKDLKIDDNESRISEDNQIVGRANIWDLGKKATKNLKDTKQIDMYATMEAFDHTQKLQISDVQFYRVENKKPEESVELEKPTALKAGGRRMKLRKTQQVFRTNAIEVLQSKVERRQKPIIEGKTILFEDQESQSP